MFMPPCCTVVQLLEGRGPGLVSTSGSESVSRLWKHPGMLFHQLSVLKVHWPEQSRKWPEIMKNHWWNMPLLHGTFMNLFLRFASCSSQHCYCWIYKIREELQNINRHKQKAYRHRQDLHTQKVYRCREGLKTWKRSTDREVPEDTEKASIQVEGLQTQTRLRHYRPSKHPLQTFHRPTGYLPETHYRSAIEKIHNKFA